MNVNSFIELCKQNWQLIGVAVAVYTAVMWAVILLIERFTKAANLDRVAIVLIPHVYLFYVVKDGLARHLAARSFGGYAEDFELRFGFFPATDYTTRQSTQTKVDRTLSDLAYAFRRACDYEEQLQKTGVTDPQTRADAAGQVAKEKAEFWKAHGLAKRMMYEVRPSHFRYLR